MMRIATYLAVISAAEAQNLTGGTKYKCNNKSKITCTAPRTDADLDACVCICPETDCEAYQYLNGGTCVCEDLRCDPCSPGEGGTA